MGIIEKLTTATRGYGTQDDVTNALSTKPWEWKSHTGIYAGPGGSPVWLYRQFPLVPQHWEDVPKRIQIGNDLYELLAELGDESIAAKSGVDLLSSKRDVHIMSLTWDEIPTPPETNSARLRRIQQETFTFTVPHRALLVGIKLRAGVTTDSAVKTGKDKLASFLKQDGLDLDRYGKDLAKIEDIFAKHNCVPPTPEQEAQLESHHNRGRGTSVVLEQTRDHIRVEDGSRLEYAAVHSFHQPIMYAPNARWIAEALNHPAGVHLVSIRGELEPSEVARNRARRNQRRVIAQMEEEAAAGDLERSEDTESFQYAKAVEDYFTGAGTEALFANASIILGRRVDGDARETYRDWLGKQYAIQVEPLIWQQLDALDEVQPCSKARINPWPQDVNLAMLGHAGLNAYSGILGDPCGGYAGLSDPDMVPVYYDYDATTKHNVPAATLLVGDSGSGKSWLWQLLLIQAALDTDDEGLPRRVIAINPKSGDSLRNMVILARQLGIEANIITLSALETNPGAFDPFRICPNDDKGRRQAAEIATAHILTVLGPGWDQRQTLALTDGMFEGASAGATCVGQALRYVNDREVISQIEAQAKASTLFALGISPQPQANIAGGRGLTLIEFDRKLDKPRPQASPSEWTHTQRLTIAANRIVTQSVFEMLRNADGGVFGLDEAWTFLKGNSDAVAMMDEQAREARSKGIVPIWATQRPADLLDAELDGFLSRVFALKCQKRDDAIAAIKLVGLEPTESNIANLQRNFGHKVTDAGKLVRVARAFHRDLQGRRSVVWIGPTHPKIAAAISTDRTARKQFQAEQDALAADDQTRRSQAAEAAGRAQQLGTVPVPS